MSSNCVYINKDYRYLRKCVLQAIHSQRPSTFQMMKQVKIKRALYLLVHFHSCTHYPEDWTPGFCYLLHTGREQIWHEELTGHGGGPSSTSPPLPWHGNLSAVQASFNISHRKVWIDSEMEQQNFHVARRCALHCGTIFCFFRLQALLSSRNESLFFKCKIKHIDCHPVSLA